MHASTLKACCKADAWKKKVAIFPYIAHATRNTCTRTLRMQHARLYSYVAYVTYVNTYVGCHPHCHIPTCVCTTLRLLPLAPTRSKPLEFLFNYTMHVVGVSPRANHCACSNKKPLATCGCLRTQSRARRLSWVVVALRVRQGLQESGDRDHLRSKEKRNTHGYHMAVGHRGVRISPVHVEVQASSSCV